MSQINLFKQTVTPGTPAINEVNVFINASKHLATVDENGLVIDLASPTSSSSFSATTLSGGTIYSGNTELGTLFATSSQVTTINSQLATKANLSGATFTGSVSATSLSATTLSGGTIYSGSTDLSTLFATPAQIITINSQLVTKANLSGATFTGQVNATSLSATTISGGTIFSGSTDLSTLFATPAQIITINSQLVTKANLSGATFTGSVSASSLSSTTLSGGTIYSGSTELGTLFGTVANVSTLQSQILTKANLSGATFTGSVSATSLSATTLSGGTIYSGSTELGTLFATPAQITTLNSQFATKANLSGATFTGSVSATSLSATSFSAGTIYPKTIEGLVYINTGNTQGWTGTDVGGWINDAYNYIKTTYNANYGGIIHLAPGNYNFGTPISAATVGFSFILRGCGDGNGATVLNYTATTGNAMSVGGGSGNNGGVLLENFTLNGTAIGNGATGIMWGLAGIAGVAGASVKMVSINKFTTGISALTNGSVYAVNLVNTKIQFCTTGWAPFGENNCMFGGLFGKCTNAIVPGGASCEVQLFGTAFDDNTTTSINLSNNSQRFNLYGCRFENPSTGTSNYITISAGSLLMDGGALQDDVSTGTSTGFIQATGGVIHLDNIWLYSAGRAYAQAFNIASPTVYSESQTIISPATVTPATSFSAITTSAYRGSIIATPAGITTTETLVVGVPLPANTLTVGTTYRIECYATVGTSTAGTVTGRIRIGTNNTIADTVVSSVVDVAQAVAAQVFHLGTFTVRTLGSTGTVMGTLLQSVGTVLTNSSAAPVAATVNSTVNNFLNFTLQGGGTASPTITVTNAYIQLIKSN